MSEKLQGIVDQIKDLSLLEVTNLVVDRFGGSRL